MNGKSHCIKFQLYILFCMRSMTSEHVHYILSIHHIYLEKTLQDYLLSMCFNTRIIIIKEKDNH